VLKAKVHSAKIMDRDGVEPLLQGTDYRFLPLKNLWLDAGYNGRAREWIEGALGWTVEGSTAPAEDCPAGGDESVDQRVS